MPAIETATLQHEYVRGSRDAILAAIALELYRRRHGGWPATLDALVPSLLPSVPVDRFTGQPLRYRIIDGMPRLYSVGANLTDDAGTPAKDDYAGNGWRYPRPWSHVQAKGDWILWPPVDDVMTPTPIAP
jgi:hypothetical protein